MQDSQTLVGHAMPGVPDRGEAGQADALQSVPLVSAQTRATVPAALSHLWQDEGGRKAQCTYARARPCWGRYQETVETESGLVRKQRNVRARALLPSNPRGCG